jgi:RNA polymerase sigma-70 factor (ECF subfamily)
LDTPSHDSADASVAEQARWFTEQVRPHEPALRAYLRKRFADVHDIDEVVQESYVRVLAARAKGGITSVRAYLFTTVRNAALSIVRRPRIFSDLAVTDFAVQRVAEEGVNVSEAVSVKQEIAILLEAIDALPARCREIFILRKLEGVSQKDIAARLGLSEQTVQVQIARGAKKCADYLRRNGRRRSTRRQRIGWRSVIADSRRLKSARWRTGSRRSRSTPPRGASVRRAG